MARAKIALLIPIFLSFVEGAEISSKIDLEDEKPTPPATLSSSVLKAFVDLNQGAGIGPKSPGIFPKHPPQGFRLPGQPKQREDDFVNIDEFLKEKRRQGVGQNNIGGSTTKPTIINNIHVTINTNDSGPGVNRCTDGVCDVRVSSNPDGNGNLVTDVHLSVVTKLGKAPNVEDIPVINGFSDRYDERRPNYDELPAFHFLDQHHVPFNAQYFDNNIPQIPIHRQDHEPWYQTQRMISQPAAAGPWHYGRSLDQAYKGLRGQKTWVPRRGIVDDKIEPPLSQTKSEDDRVKE